MEKNDKVLEAIEKFLINRIEKFDEKTSADEIQAVTDLFRAATVRKEVNRKNSIGVGDKNE